MAGKRIAVVTGANKGIGFGIMKELCAKLDGIVYLTARDEGRGKDALRKLSELGFSARFHQLDIDNQQSIDKFANYIKTTYGGFDVLVNNAGMAYKEELISYSTPHRGNGKKEPDIKVQQFRLPTGLFKSAATEPFSEKAENTIRVNFTGTLNVCRALFPLLHSGARVCNVSSMTGHLSKFCGEEPAASTLRDKFASPTLTEDEIVSLVDQFIKAAKAGNWKAEGWPNSTYVVSKVGTSALTRVQQRAFDADSRTDMVVNNCYPGYVDTDMSSHKGPLTIEQGAVCPSYLALLPPNIKEPRGAYLWYDKQVVDWVKGPTPALV